jgi:gamma-glutamyltranspeptidase/glutathione hydrolase
LVSKDYATKLAAKIDLKRATPVPTHATPERATEDVFGKHTTHFSTADAEGNWVACTATVNTTFGAKVVIPGTGIVMNNQMDDFSIQPGVANAFGLLGAEANAVAPGKRPLSSMSPTIVLKDGKPILAVGAAGGPTIISQTLLAIVNTIDFGMPLDEALAQPRFHHQWQPDELRVEKTVPEKVREELAKRGHKVKVVETLGAAQAVALDGNAGKLAGAPDPRGEGQAAGF